MTTAPTTETEAAEAIAAEAPPAGAIAAPVGGLSLRKNFSWTFVGNVVYAACQWGILVVLAKLGTPEMVGQFALGLAVTAPVIMFSQLQLRGVQATDAKREYQFGDYLALRLITTALALAVIVGIVAVSGYKRETALVILIVGAMKGVDALSDVYYGLWQQNERMDSIAQALMLNGVLSTAALVAIIAATHNIVLAVLGTATGSVSALLFTLFRNRRLALATGSISRCTRSVNALWGLAALALPLGIASFLASLNANVPRYVIERASGASELGIFAALAYVVTVGTTVVTALGQSATPRLARLYSMRSIGEVKQLLRNLLLTSGMLGIAGIVVAMCGGKMLLSSLYSPEYGNYNDVFIWMMVGALFTYTAFFLNYALTAFRLFTALSVATAIAVATIIVASLVLIPRFGLIGAALACLLAAIVQVVLAGGFITQSLSKGT